MKLWPALLAAAIVVTLLCSVAAVALLLDADRDRDRRLDCVVTQLALPVEDRTADC